MARYAVNQTKTLASESHRKTKCFTYDVAVSRTAIGMQSEPPVEHRSVLLNRLATIHETSKKVG